MSEVRVTQVVAEVMVPFTEGNTTMAGVTTERFDGGDGAEWYIVAPIVDSGSELRSKTVGPIHATGKLTNASFSFYTYDVEAGIDLDDLEEGANPTVGPVAITDSTQVAQTARMRVSIPNSCLHTVRIDGDDRGESVRDTLHEIVYEISHAGVRR